MVHNHDNINLKYVKKKEFSFNSYDSLTAPHSQSHQSIAPPRRIQDVVPDYRGSYEDHHVLKATPTVDQLDQENVSYFTN